MSMGVWRPRAAIGAGVIALLLASGCGDKTCPPNAPCPTPTPGTGGGGGCANIQGTRNMFWSDSCPRSGSGQIVISQLGCGFQGNLSGLGNFAGTISGNNLSYTLTFTDPCGGSATGTAVVSGAAVSGMYSGTQTGPSPCCSNPKGTFSFDFAPTPVPTTPTVTPAVGVGAGLQGKKKGGP